MPQRRQSNGGTGIVGSQMSRHAQPGQRTRALDVCVPLLCTDTELVQLRTFTPQDVVVSASGF